APVQLQCVSNQAFMARHDVGKVPKALRRVTLRPNVDVDPAAPAGVAFCASVSELPAKLLQGCDIPVGQDRGDQLAFLVFRPRDVTVLLEFPLAPLAVPCTPGAVPVASGSILIPACTKVGSGNFGCLLAGNVVHLNLYPYGLLFHPCDLHCCFLVHSEILRFLPRGCVFSLSVYTYSL